MLQRAELIRANLRMCIPPVFHRVRSAWQGDRHAVSLLNQTIRQGFDRYKRVSVWAFQSLPSLEIPNDSNQGSEFSASNDTNRAFQEPRSKFADLLLACVRITHEHCRRGNDNRSIP